MTDVWQSSDGIDLGTGDVVEWIVIQRVDDTACDVQDDLLDVR